MTSFTPKFEKILRATVNFGGINHAPDAQGKRLRNTPNNSLPFADHTGSYQRNKGIPFKSYKDSKVYIVGSGIAGLSAAFYFMRDGGIPGENITFLEQSSLMGGSLDGGGNAQDGYIVRGGREMDMTYENLFDMLQDIPALELPEPYSVLDEYRLLNDHDPNYSKARLLHQRGQVQDFSKFNLTRKDRWALIKLLLKRKEELDNVSIESYFSQSFFDSTFWTFWRTMFAFQSWHSALEFKLYMHRFLHALDGLHDMSALVFPKYNQYDTFVRPIRDALKEKGVHIQYDTLVKDINLKLIGENNVVTDLITEQCGNDVAIPVGEADFVVITTGSMTADTRYGDSHKPPEIKSNGDGEDCSPGWNLWNNLAKKSSVFGKPEKFCSNPELSAWESATLTCKPSPLTEKLRELAVNDPYSGKTVTGGIITVTDSNWLISFTCNRQPHFPNQPEDTLVLWLYGLLMDKKGNYILKTMPECTGHEILTELCFHLNLLNDLEDILANTIARTAYMPYITSMFMPRAGGDRPESVPNGYLNLGLAGQFVETNNDVVFTVETSVRTARVAVYTLVNCSKQVPDITPSQYDIRQLLKAMKTLNDDKGFFGERVLKRLLKDTYFEHILP